jgi:tetratricopeptide (TPR) repeat protein
MKKLVTALSICVFSFAAMAQQTKQSPHDMAYGYMRSGDYPNAILVLTKAIQNDENNQQLIQDLALSYYYSKDYVHAKEQVTKLLNRDDVDIVSYQIGGNVHKALEEVKDAEKMYKKALKKFPSSGALYSEYGELLWERKDVSAIRQWEKGIEVDPSYAGNFYNAALYYYYTKDKVWSIIYGEIFVNMEYLTGRATEIKKLLLNSYKEKLFTDIGDPLPRSGFAKAVLETYGKESPLVKRGLSVETLTMIRTKFILDWFAKYGEKYPFKLFDLHQQLIREGMFEAYNEWLFGPVDNLSNFDQWTKGHADSYNKFQNFQHNRVFKMPPGQYYQVMDKK